MDFTPKYPQPFSLAQALALEPSVITEEISRLQNSLGYLRISNVELVQYLRDEGEDVDLRESVNENELTIASQQERIEMLRLALMAKIGVRPDNDHYNSLASAAPPPPPQAPIDSFTPASQQPSITSSATSQAPSGPPPGLPAPTAPRPQSTLPAASITTIDDDDAGVYL